MRPRGIKLVSRSTKSSAWLLYMPPGEIGIHADAASRPVGGQVARQADQPGFHQPE